MTNTERYPIDCTIPIEQIEDRIKELKRIGQSAMTRRSLSRLGFIHLRYTGFTVRDATGIVGVSVQTGYSWQREWNKSGMESVRSDRPMGRVPRLSHEDRMALVDFVASKNLSTLQASEYISENYGIDYSIKQVHTILSNSGLVHIPRIKSTESADATSRDTSRMVWSRPDRVRYLVF